MNYQKEQQLRNCLARNLRYLRMSRSPCFSQKMLAKKLGVTQKSISRYENAKCLPPTHVFVALTEEFGLAMDELFMERLPQNIKKKDQLLKVK
jgi:DNA-binding XRE family transcriptional regulator